MGNQFMHAEVYGRSGSSLKGAKRAKDGTARKSGSGGWSAREVLAEVLREPQASRHVPSPKPPESLYGDIEALKDDLDALPEKRPGMRKDTPILMACIASAPWPPGDPRSKKWRKDVIKHFKKKYGDNLKAVIGHSDEPYDHLHLYIALPDLAPIKSVHPGMCDREAIKAAGGKGFEIEAAFNNAMKSWQDEYFVEVGIPNAQTRVGPGKRRLTHAEWIAEQTSAEHAATALRVIEQAQESARIASDALTQRAKAMEAEAMAMAAEIEMQALQVTGQVNAHSQAEEARLLKVKAALDAGRARQADERARQAEMVERLKKAELAHKAKSESLVEKQVHLDVLVQEAQTKVNFLDKMIGDFQSAMSSIHDRLSFFEKKAILPFLSAVASVKARFAGIHGREKQKAKSGLDL